MEQPKFCFVDKDLSPDIQESLWPKRHSEAASGFDLASASLDSIAIKPGERKLIPTGISIELPIGLEGQVRSRSGLAYKKGLMVLNSPGTIDADYRGEIKVILNNFGNEEVIINFGMRIAQLVICPIASFSLELKNNLSNSQRGEDGFGSTGI